ncbi:MAG: hypothetical protein ACRDRY_09915 [Pseudonocardiaceae bacterium]
MANSLAAGGPAAPGPRVGRGSQLDVAIGVLLDDGQRPAHGSGEDRNPAGQVNNALLTMRQRPAHGSGEDRKRGSRFPSGSASRFAREDAG